MQAELTECRKELARYHGALSRWCDLTGNVPDAGQCDNKTEEEFVRFSDHLDKLAAERRATKNSQEQGGESWKF